MQRWFFMLCVLSALYGGGGVTQSSLSKFWNDDYKVFEQIYGKTSDRNLFTDSLPLSFDVDDSKWKVIKATDKNERLIDEDTLLGADTQIDNTGLDNYNNNAFAKQAKEVLKEYQRAIKLSNKPLKFIPATDFKPISVDTDPETYEYLRNLEQRTTKFSDDYQPYRNPKIEEEDAYKSVQYILDAHEANRGVINKNIDEGDLASYAKYDTKKGKAKQNSRLINKNKLRCSGRCGKPTSFRSRSRPRPVVRKIKHTIISS